MLERRWNRRENALDSVFLIRCCSDMTHTHTHTTWMTSQCVTLQDDSENEQAMSVTCARMKQPERTVEVFTPD